MLVLPHDGEGAMLHVLDLADLFEQPFRSGGCVHDYNMEEHLYIKRKKPGKLTP